MGTKTYCIISSERQSPELMRLLADLTENDATAKVEAFVTNELVMNMIGGLVEALGENNAKE